MQTSAEINTTAPNSFGTMIVTYLVALSLVALLSFGGYLTLRTVIASQKTSSTLINVSGRQRRLSQTIAFYCLKLATSSSQPEREECRARLSEAIDLMSRCHTALTDLSGDFNLPRTMSPAVRKIYFEAPQNLDAEVKRYLTVSRKILGSNDAGLTANSPDVSFVTTEGPGHLIGALDEVVNQYELESQEQVAKIEHMELGLLIATILLLTCEASFIFFPLSRRLQKQVQKIIDSQRELSAIFDTVGDALITFNSDHKITTANMQVQKIWGSSTANLIGRPLDSLIRNGHEQVSMTGTNMLGRYMESEALREDGETVPLEMIVTKTNLSDRVSYTVSLRDITDRKNTEKRISEFYSVVAHELRSPLTSIQGTLQILQGGLAGQLSPESRKFVDVGVEETVRLTRLINDFLDLKKIASGNFELDKTTHPLYAIAGTAVSSLINMGSQNGVKLELQGNSDITVSCDRDRMIQVFNNLISNAIKFSPKDATVKVSIELSSDNTKVRCSVIDKGPGIAVNDMPKLFAMFQQVGQRPAGASKGTGLGLAISKALIEQHGGTIGIDSSLGSGSVFWFELPLAGTKDRPVD